MITPHIVPCPANKWPSVSMAIWLKTKKAEWVYDRGFRWFLLLPLLSVCSNDNTQWATNSFRELLLQNELPETCYLKLIFYSYYSLYCLLWSCCWWSCCNWGPFPISTQDTKSSYRICSLIKLSATPCPPLTLNCSLGAAFLRVAWLTISTVPLPVTSDYPWLRHCRFFPSLPFLPLSWLYMQQSG